MDAALLSWYERGHSSTVDDLLEALCAVQYGTKPWDYAEDHTSHCFVVSFKCISHGSARRQRERTGYCNIKPQIGVAEEQPRMTGTLDRQHLIVLP